MDSAIFVMDSGAGSIKAGYLNQNNPIVMPNASAKGGNKAMKSCITFN